MELFVIIGINNQGFPDIKETFDHKPDEDTIDFYRRNGIKVTVAQIRLYFNPYHRESFFHMPIQ